MKHAHVWTVFDSSMDSCQRKDMEDTGEPWTRLLQRPIKESSLPTFLSKMEEGRKREKETLAGVVSLEQPSRYSAC